MLVSLQLEDGGSAGWSQTWRRIEGILEEVTSSSMTVSLEKMEGWVVDGLVGRRSPGVKIVKRSEEKLYTNSSKQLRKLLNYELSDKHLPARIILESVLGPGTESSPSPSPSPQILTIFNKKLLSDESKMTALQLCSLCLPLTLLHGPPGTGKTTTLAAAVLSAVKNGEKVLVVAPSHAACDAVTLAITEHSDWVRLTRLGSKLRLTSTAVERFLPDQLRPSPSLERLGQRLGWVRRQLLDGHRGRGELLEEEARLVAQQRREYREHEEQLMKEAEVVVCTLQTSFRASILRMVRQDFDLVCVDEAGFSLDSQVLPVVAGARRLILAGDHLQLPPVVLSEEARARGLAQSLFERLVSSKYLEKTVAVLKVQYRSNKIISDWSSGQFYQSLLRADPGNAEISLEQIVSRTALARYSEEAWLLTRPLLWLDTKGKDWEEDVEDEESISNIGEAVMVANIVAVLTNLGLDQRDIGVISPYWAQVGLVRTLLWETDRMTGVEVRTVDGYQGREKETVILSLVRSNTEAEVGFLSESRRINVSVTRAKRCCIIIGDSSTLRSDSCLESLWDYCYQREAVISVDKINL